MHYSEDEIGTLFSMKDTSQLVLTREILVSSENPFRQTSALSEQLLKCMSLAAAERIDAHNGRRTRRFEQWTSTSNTCCAWR
jgi:hypothetical protein